MSFTVGTFGYKSWKIVVNVNYEDVVPSNEMAMLQGVFVGGIRCVWNFLVVLFVLGSTACSSDLTCLGHNFFWFLCDLIYIVRA